MPVGLILKEIAETVPWTYLIIAVAAVMIGESLGIPVAGAIVQWFEQVLSGLIDWIVNEFLGGVIPW